MTRNKNTQWLISVSTSQQHCYITSLKTGTTDCYRFVGGYLHFDKHITKQIWTDQSGERCNEFQTGSHLKITPSALIVLYGLMKYSGKYEFEDMAWFNEQSFVRLRLKQ